MIGEEVEAGAAAHLLVLRHGGHQVEGEVGRPLDDVLVGLEEGVVHGKVLLHRLEHWHDLLDVRLGPVGFQ